MIYLTGGSGRLGTEVLKILHSAVPLVRKPSGLKNEKICDFSGEQLKKILQDATVVIHLAGSMNFLDEREMWETNVGITQRLVEATPKNARIIFASSISVYGKKLQTLPADENTEVKPDSEYAKSKLQAETEIIEKNSNAIILRIGTIYGPGFEDYYRIIKMIKNGRMSILGDGTNRLPFVHVNDVAEAIAKAATKATVKPGKYLIVGESLPQTKVYDIAAKELGVEPPKKRVSKIFALFFAWIEESNAKLFGSKPKITREHIMVLTSDREFNCSKAKKELGFAPRPIRNGIAEIIKNLKEE